jgi:diguanylate cyclase (GGDEF)-like protein
LIFFLIVFYITSHLKKISELSVKLTEEEVTPELKLPYSSNDEIGQLISNFNLFIDESYKLIKFKKTIEEDNNLETVYNRIFSLLNDEFNIENFNLFEVNNSKNSMKLIVSKGKLCCKQDIFLDINMCRAARTANIVNSFEDRKMCMSFTCFESHRYICVPLIVGGNVGNVLQLIYENENVDMKIISRLAKFLKEAAPVIEAKRLLEQLKDSTLKDPLTTLYNRRFLDESAEMLAASTLRRNSKAGILMCDIDFFKKVNDVYGHNIGDRVLKEVAKVLKNSVRASDIVVRFGGEEFLIILQDVDGESSVAIAEKIRSNVEQLEIRVSGHALKKTVSIGVSVFPDDAKSFWQCIKFSDVALYKAKKTGRNKVVRFEHSMWEENDF